MNFKRSCITGMSITVSLMLSACAYMPTSGPTAKSVVRSGEQIGDQAAAKAAENLEQKAVIVDMDAHISSVLGQRSQRRLFSETWRDSVEPNVVGSGDVLEVTIWEAPPSVLFGGATNAIGASNARDVKLPPQMVNQDGTIQIPFIGAIRVRGRAIPQIEKEIASRLSRMANQPQVMVTPLKNNSSNVAVIGDGGLSVNMPLTAKKERVLDAITAVGGKISSRTSIQVTRGSTVRSLPLLSITQDPRQNITLRAGDIVSVLNQPYSFVALGATGQNNELPLEAGGITLAQAFGRIRGVNNNQADAAGVFVFRYEDADTVAQWDESRAREPHGQKVPVVYRANLRNPNTFFYAQNFVIQDKDIIFVADAPAWKLQKFLAMVGAIVSPFNTFSSSVVNSTNAVNKVEGW